MRVRVDGEMLDLDEVKTLDKYKRHTIEAVVDRLVIHHADDDGRAYDDSHPNPDRGRFADSVETALRLGEGVMVVAAADQGAFEEQRYSEKYSCPFDGYTIDELEPRSFSFNSPHGACPVCTGLGMRMEFDPERVINRNLSVSEGALLPWQRMTMTDSWYGKVVEAMAKRQGFSVDTPLGRLKPEDLDFLLNSPRGEKVRIGYRHNGHTNYYEATFEGLLPNLNRRYRETDSEWVKQELREVHGCPAVSDLRRHAPQARDAERDRRRTEHRPGLGPVRY